MAAQGEHSILSPRHLSLSWQPQRLPAPGGLRSRPGWAFSINTGTLHTRPIASSRLVHQNLRSATSAVFHSRLFLQVLAGPRLCRACGRHCTC